MRINSGQATGEYKGKKRFVAFVAYYALGIARQIAGISDLICCTPQGRFVALEVKLPGKEPTAKQVSFMDAVREAGGIAEVVSSLDDVENIINRVNPKI